MPSLTHEAGTTTDDEPDEELPDISKRSKNLNQFLASNPKINEKPKATALAGTSQKQSSKKTPLAKNATPSSSSLPDKDYNAPTKKTGYVSYKDKEQIKPDKSFSSDSLPLGLDPPESRDDEMQIDVQDNNHSPNTTPRPRKSQKPLFGPASDDSEGDGTPSVAAVSTPKVNKAKQVSRLQKLSQKRKKKNPFIDDEAELSGDAEDTGGEMTDDNPGSLIEFINDNTEVEEDDSDFDELQESEPKSKLPRMASPEV
jgi:hypothetical protein